MTHPPRVLVYTGEMPPHGLDRIRKAFPQLPVTRITHRRELAHALADAEILFGGVFGDELSGAHTLRWIHYPGVGVDRLLAAPGLAERNIIVTHTRGVFGATMAEYAMAAILYLARGFPIAVSAAAERRWVNDEMRRGVVELAGKTLGILGLGDAGSALAVRARAFDMLVLGLRAHPDQSSPGVDRVLGFDGLPNLLSESDFVVLALPLTSRTHGMIGHDELRRMKRSAFLVNMARGAIVDEPALIEALQSGVIRGAVLDVFQNEPLPADSPLWSLPNVLVTPHMAGDSEHHPARVLERFLDNLGRYLAGQPLLHVVDGSRGY